MKEVECKGTSPTAPSTINSSTETSSPSCYVPNVVKGEKTNILGLVVFSCFFGAIIGRMGKQGEPIKNFVVALMEATMRMIGIIIW